MFFSLLSNFSGKQTFFLDVILSSTDCYWLIYKLLPPATKLRQGNVFTPVCQSFCSQTPPPGQTPPGQTIPPPPEQTPPPSACWDTQPPAQCMLGYTPLPVHTGIDMATAADGTHPTGMHSC